MHFTSYKWAYRKIIHLRMKGHNCMLQYNSNTNGSCKPNRTKRWDIKNNDWCRCRKNSYLSRSSACWSWKLQYAMKNTFSSSCINVIFIWYNPLPAQMRPLIYKVLSESSLCHQKWKKEYLNNKKPSNGYISWRGRFRIYHEVCCRAKYVHAMDIWQPTPSARHWK
jgi:hypothetical protein